MWFQLFKCVTLVNTGHLWNIQFIHILSSKTSIEFLIFVFIYFAFQQEIQMFQYLFLKEICTCIYTLIQVNKLMGFFVNFFYGNYLTKKATKYLLLLNMCLALGN